MSDELHGEEAGRPVTKRDSRPHKRRAPRAWSALALAAAVLTTVVIIAPRLVPADWLSPRVAEALAAATGAEVEVGSARLTLIGGPGLQATGVTIRLEDRYALQLDQAGASLAVWPLLRRELVVDGLDARGSGTSSGQRDGGGIDLRSFRLKARRLNLKLPDPGAATPAPASVAGGAGWRWPAGLRGDLDLTVGQLTRWSVTWTDVRAEASMRGGALEVREIAGSCGEGRLRASGAYDPAGSTGEQLTVAATIERLLPAHLVRPLTQPEDWGERVKVPLTGSCALSCTPGDAATVLSTVSGEGHFGAAAGQVNAGDWLDGVSQYLGDRQDLTDIRIDDLRLALRLADGVCRVDTLVARGPDTAWDIAGDVGLDGALDLAVHLRLPPGFTPRLGSLSFFAEALRDPDGRVNLDLRLKGPLPDPAVSLDLSRLSKKRAGKAF